MAIGSLGEIIFEASDDVVRTIKDFQRQGAARYATHDVIGRKPLREFIGPGLEKISFNMQLSTTLGVNPAGELRRLRTIRDSGDAIELILDGSPVGEELWTIEDLSESWSHMNKSGGIVFAIVSVTLQEYPRDPIKSATLSSSYVASEEESASDDSSSENEDEYSDNESDDDWDDE